MRFYGLDTQMDWLSYVLIGLRAMLLMGAAAVVLWGVL
jgi:hypothetical protein